MASRYQPTAKVRYRIIALIFVITTINYADRATFSIAGNAASNELGLDPGPDRLSSSRPLPGPMPSARSPAARCSTGSAPSTSTPSRSLSGRCSPLLQGLSGFVPGIAAVTIAVRPALSGRPGRGALLSRQRPPGRRMVPRTGARHRFGDLQLRAIFLAGRLRAADGLAGPQLWLAIGVLGDGRRWASSRRSPSVSFIHSPVAILRSTRPSSTTSKPAAG